MIIKPPPKLTNQSALVRYVEIDLWSWLKQLATGILKIDFLQNYQSFIVTDLILAPVTEVAIANQFKNIYPGTIPTKRIIVRQRGDANIIDGATEWNENLVYLFNPSANEVKINVIFFK